MMQLAKITPDDVDFLANEWEFLISSFEYPRFEHAMHCITTIVDCFLRGKDVIFERSSRPPQDIMVARAACLLTVQKRVSNDEHKAEHFPTLCKLGFSDLNTSLATLEEKLEPYGIWRKDVKD